NARKQIVDYLRSKQDVEVSAFLFSNWDIDLKIWARHPGQFYDFYNSFIDKFSEYIAEKDFSLITGVHYLSHAHIHGHRSDLFIGKQYSQEIPEEEDACILDALKKDARQDVVSLARNCKLALHIVRYRIKQLTKKGILKGVIPVIDTTKLGYNQYNVELILNQPSMRQSIVKHLKTLNPITRIYELIGRHDISFEAQFKSNDELDTFLEELRLHGNEIKDFQVMNMISK
ncbi:MAG TPA: Lrp/AsnC family transcriptional regulator, partial [Candidatus Nanoarchaeia archaeon]|nr:Lrp/AsnC family transcriptional regulator [Candidatus Nanoarchaeia archaeon]